MLTDIRLAVRQLLHSRAYTLVCLLTLALCIGENTAMFSIVRAVLLRPLPFAHAERIVTVQQTNAEKGIDSSNVSTASYLAWRPELAIRLALGANRANIQRLILGRGMKTIVAGLLWGDSSQRLHLVSFATSTIRTESFRSARVWSHLCVRYHYGCTRLFAAGAPRCRRRSTDDVASGVRKFTIDAWPEY